MSPDFLTFTTMAPPYLSDISFKNGESAKDITHEYNLIIRFWLESSVMMRLSEKIYRVCDDPIITLDEDQNIFLVIFCNL